ncbi:MAG: YybS family protein [Firmicutes bacterium]|nr:YybS family protein [Bacillota bacterium]
MRKPNSTRSLTEGAMLAAITVLLSLLGAYFMPYLFFITPVPLIILVYRHGMRPGILVAVTSALLGGIVLSTVPTMIFLLILGLVGLAMGEALREGFPPHRIMLIGTATSVISLLLMVAVTAVFLDFNVLETTFETMERSLQQALKVYERFGVEEHPLFKADSLGEFMRLLKLALPAALLTTAIIMTFVNYWLARLILNRLGTKLPWLKSFRLWRFPWYLAWGYILGQGLLLVTQGQGNGNLWFGVGLNLQILFNYVFLLQGLAILWFFLDKANLPKLVRWLIIIFVFNPLFTTLVVWLGVLDTWFNFRKLGEGEPT